MTNFRSFSKTGLLAAVMALFLAGCTESQISSEASAKTGHDHGHGGETVALCEPHGAPVSLCFVCDPDLREKDRLWCREHARYEDRCFVCHPELEDPDRAWCAEHFLYEDECVLCRPGLAGAYGRTSIPEDLRCLEHDVLELECGICHPELAAELEPGDGLKVRLRSAASADLAGLQTVKPEQAVDRRDAGFLARVVWNENTFAHVTPFAGGVIREVHANLGDTVRRGEKIAALSSPEVARAKSAYLTALAEEELARTVLVREQQLVEQRVSAQQDLDQARAAHRMAMNTASMARQQLMNYGLTEADVHRLETTGSTSSRLDILAPLSGTIVDRHAVPGEVVEPGDALFSLADLSTMWLELSVPEDRVASIRVGLEVVAGFDAQAGLENRGRLIWIGSSVDEASRMVKAKAEVPNPEGLLRHGMFGHARIAAAPDGDGLFIPRDALQLVDGETYVFVRLEDNLFELRRVLPGSSTGRRVSILDGISPHEPVVAEHSFVLKAELLKSRLGAGCVHD